MSPDDLIASFDELARSEPNLRIERRVIDLETLRLTSCGNAKAARRFKALVADAAALVNAGGHGDAPTRWLRFVIDNAPELVEDAYAGAGGEQPDLPRDA